MWFVYFFNWKYVSIISIIISILYFDSPGIEQFFFSPLLFFFFFFFLYKSMILCIIPKDDIFEVLLYTTCEEFWQHCIKQGEHLFKNHYHSIGKSFDNNFGTPRSFTKEIFRVFESLTSCPVTHVKWQVVLELREAPGLRCRQPFVLKRWAAHDNRDAQKLSQFLNCP